MRFTVFGSAGFIGSRLVASLESAGHECLRPPRGTLPSGELGHVVYAVGVTADFRTRPFDTARAHVGLLTEVLETCRFESLLYLSSARVYAGLDVGHEDAALRVRPGVADELYNITKAAGESLCLTSPRPTIRVVRLSNVYGDDVHSPTFLASLIRDAVSEGVIHLRTSRRSEKDYVSVADVVRLLPRIAVDGRSRVYNVASGRNRSHGDIVDRLAALTGCQVSEAEDAPTIIFPPIDVSRVQAEFGDVATDLLDQLPTLIAQYRSVLCSSRST